MNELRFRDDAAGCYSGLTAACIAARVVGCGFFFVVVGGTVGRFDARLGLEIWWVDLFFPWKPEEDLQAGIL